MYGQLLILIKSFLSNTFQSQTPYVSWCSSRLYIRSSLFSYIFNDMPDGIQSNIKIFAVDMSIFPAMNDIFRTPTILTVDTNAIFQHFLISLVASCVTIQPEPSAPALDKHLPLANDLLYFSTHINLHLSDQPLEYMSILSIQIANH